MKNVMLEFIPPIVWRITGKIKEKIKKSNSKWEYGVEQPPEYYDERFLLGGHWRQHYTESRYYPLWAVIVDRIQQVNPELILDVGCGTGQFANLLHDKKIARYIGVDFSPARIEWARKICPEYRFEVEDVFVSNTIENANADCVVLLEFLEHVENDVEILQRIKEGTYVIASVPNFPGIGHVRYFKSVAEVRERFASHFRKLRIDEHLANNKGKKYYLIDGMR